MWRPAMYGYFIIVPILILAIYLAFIPKTGYLYPVHIDEWVHLAYSQAIQSADSLTYVNPFTGQDTVSFSSNLESGYQLFWAVFQDISGISWLTIFRYFPSVILAITVLSVFVMARRLGFGWEAAFFACLIPTTAGIMGPAFLVPVAMGLLFVPLSLYLVLNYRTAGAYIALFIFTAFTMVIHAPSGISLLVILAPCILLYLKSEWKHSLVLALIWICPFLVTLPWTYDLVVSTALSLLRQHGLPAYHDLPFFIKIFGNVPLALAILGSFWLALKGGTRNYCLALGLVVLLLMLATFYTWHYGVDIVYLRGLLYAFLMLGIVAGAGLMMIKNIELPESLRLPRLARKIGYPLCLALVIVVLWTVIPYRQDIGHYRMIDEADYEAFVWIRENVDESYQKAVLDPWQATAFTAITGKHVYTRLHVRPSAQTGQASSFIEDGCADTGFLRENGISIVYSRQPCSNPDLMEIRKNVYLLEGD